MSQDGRDTSDKAKPDRKDAPASGESKTESASGKGGATATSATAAGAPKKAEPQAAAKDEAGAGAAASKTSTGADKPSSGKDEAAKKPGAGKEAAAASTTAAAGGAKEAKPASRGAAPGGRRAKSSGSLAAVLWTLVVVAVGGGVAIATLPRWQPAWNDSVGQRFPALRITLGGAGNGNETKLDQRLANVESRLGDLSTLDQRSKRLSNELDQALKRISQLEAGIKEVRKVAEQVASQPAKGDASQTLNDVMRRLKALEGSAANESTLKQSVSEMQSKLSQLEQQTAKASQAAQANEAAQKQSVSEMQSKLSQLEQQTAKATQAAQANVAAQADSKALLLAVSQLRDSVRRGEPYAKDLDALRKIAGNDTEVAAALAPLQDHATTGIPTLAALTQRFEAIAGRLVSAANVSTNAPWWQRALGKVEGLVSFRRDSAAAGGVQGAVAQAEHLLSDGDLKGAVAALAEVKPKLGPEATSTLAPWLAEANARLDAERALAALHVKAISQLGGAG